MEITEIGLLLVKAEGTYGTDAAPTGVNAIPTIKDSVTYDVKSTAVDRKLQDGTLDSLPGYNATSYVELKFQYELRGNYNGGGTNLDISNGTSAQAIEIDALLQAANLAVAYFAAPTLGVQGVSAGSRNGNVVYLPGLFTTQGPSVTCYWYTGLKKHVLTGGKVDFKITLEAGKMPVIEFTVTGLYTAPVDAALPSPTFIITKPPLVDGSTITVNGFAPVLSKMEFMFGNKLAVRKSAGTAGGVAGIVITGYDPKGTMDPESVAVATNDFWGQWKASALNDINVDLGSQSGNRFNFSVFGGEYKKVDYTNSQNIRVHQASFNMTKSDLLGSSGPIFQLFFS